MIRSIDASIRNSPTLTRRARLLPLSLLGFLVATVSLASLPLDTALAGEDLSGLIWETNDTDPPIGDPRARKGGTFHNNIDAYPLTFRLFGPNSNDAFAGWNRAYTLEFPLVKRHPTTDNYIPWVATHWSVQSDNRTVYYKIDPDARWSDGETLTASDFAFSVELMSSNHIVDPYYNELMATRIESVEAIDELTLKVVGKYESWRPLDDFTLWPIPRHSTTLDAEWVQRTNNQYQIAPGPYVVTEAVPGQYVVFSRLKGWWGANKRYFQGMYNVDRIYLKVISDNDRAFDYFQKGDISVYTVTSAKRWATEMDFPAMQNGWTHRRRVFIDYPKGLYGMALNLEKPIFQNRDFRKALQYMFDFDEVNEKLMFGAYYRQVSAFVGTEYANPDLEPYGFDPVKAREHLAKAGFTKRGRDGIFVDQKGRRAAFTFTFGTRSLTRHFTVVKQKFRRLGVDMVLQLLEPGTAFERGLERQYDATIMSRTTDLFPSPKQAFHSVFTKSRNNNNIWSFGRADTDSLIDVYEKDMDKADRIAAMWKLDKIIQDEAFYIPFWTSPFIRICYWDYLQWPESVFPKRVEQVLDWQVFWIDPERAARLENAMQSNTSMGQDPIVDVDAYGVKARMEADDRAANVSGVPAVGATSGPTGSTTGGAAPPAGGR